MILSVTLTMIKHLRDKMNFRGIKFSLVSIKFYSFFYITIKIVVKSHLGLLRSIIHKKVKQEI